MQIKSDSFVGKNKSMNERSDGGMGRSEGLMIYERINLFLFVVHRLVKLKIHRWTKHYTIIQLKFFGASTFSWFNLWIAMQNGFVYNNNNKCYHFLIMVVFFIFTLYIYCFILLLLLFNHTTHYSTRDYF